MGNVLDPVAAAAGLFDKRLDVRALVVPRRDRVGGIPAPELIPDAVAEFEARPVLDAAVQHGASAGDLVTAASQPGFQDGAGLAAMTPRQAAIAAAIIVFDTPKGLRPEALADAWVAARGVPFAAEAAVELAEFAVFMLHKSNDAPALRRKTSARAFPQERFALIARVRAHLAAASDDDYAAAQSAAVSLVEGLDTLDTAGHHTLPAAPPGVSAMSAALRPGETCAAQGAAVAFLFPERTEWTDREVAAGAFNRRRADQELEIWLLLGALTTGEQAAELAYWVWSDSLRACPAATATAFASVGTDLVPALVAWTKQNWDLEARLRVQRLLAGLDSDSALRALLDMLGDRGSGTVLVEAATRFPERAIRILAEEPPTDPAHRAAADRVLRLQVTSRPDVAREVASGLGADARARVEKLLAAVETWPAADPATLPDLLVSPPWEHERTVVKPVVVNGLTPPAEAGVVWQDDAERELWGTDTLAVRTPEHMDWDKAQAALRKRFNWHAVTLLVVRGPDDAARYALRLAKDGHPWDAREWARPAVARFGVEALPAVLNALRTDLASNAELILPLGCSELAPIAADWNARLKTARTVAQAWLRRHPGVAARALVPAAL
ncbi:MAG: hypothetical protein HOV83_26210, partial [Catenulispora sp.]|nr:hypothetical protein [Catenulispora sp.]